MALIDICPREMKSVDGNRTVASSETIIYSVIDIYPYVSNLIYVLSSICNGYVFIMILNFKILFEKIFF